MINKIYLYNFNRKNISFGLNEKNLSAIATLYSNSGSDNKDILIRRTAIESMDMTDEDINPVLEKFNIILSSKDSSNIELNAVLDKINEYHGSLENLKEGFSHLMTHWSSLFLSVRAKASEIMDKYGLIHPKTGGLSRTTCNPLFGETAAKNIEEAKKFINIVTRKGKCPDKQFMIALHKILTQNLSYINDEGKAFSSPEYSGIIRGSSLDKISESNTKEVEKKLDNFFKWLENNYNDENHETFTLAAQAYKKLLGIIPFYDANGRTLRSFIDALLLSKGYKFKEYPNNYAEVRCLKTEEIAKLIKDNCELV